MMRETLKEKEMKSITTKSKLTRTLIWVGGIIGTLLLVYVSAIALTVTRMGGVPSDLDYSTTRTSDKAFFNVSYTASTGTVPVNQMHQWTLHVESTDGKPVEDATINVDGDMPQHGHGLPTSPRVTKYLGNGDYLVDGMKFQMGGWWLMDFTISANGHTDNVHFNMMLK
jgi:YtkA-like